MNYGLGRRGIAALTAAFVLGFAMLAHGVPASAQEITEDHLAAARKTIEASQSTTRLDNILPEMGQKAKQQLIANRPDAAEQINTIVDEATISLAPRRGDLETEIARAYARIFTQDELNTITEFYQTEAGKKLISETPVVARAIQEAARVWSQGIQRDLQQQVTQKIQEAGLQ